MTTNLCARCGRPEPDAYVCDRCASQSAQKLAEIAELSPPCRDVANGLSRRSHAGGSGKPGSRLPLDLGAMAKLDAVENALTGWARHIAEERGLHLDTFRPVGDQVPWLARWLVSGVEWYRHRPEADEFLTDVEACLRIVRSIARGPQESKYLGPCGADRDHEPLCVDQVGHPHDEECECWCHDGKPDTCEGDVYGRVGAATGTCRTCGATVDQDERRAWLDDEVRQRAFTAREIADAYGLNVKTIRSWADRGQLAAHGHDRDGRPLHNVGDVLDLAAADAARRESNRATRERRAARAAESEQVA